MFHNTSNEALIKALEEKDLATIKNIFEFSCCSSSYPLVAAILEGDLERVKLASKEGAALHFFIEMSEFASLGSLLESVIQFGYVEVLQWLVESHLSRLYIDQFKLQTRECFLDACYHGQLEIATWLVECSHVDLRVNGRTGFMYAVNKGHLHIVEWLYNQCKHDHSAFWRAVYNGQVQVAQWLLSKGNALSIYEKENSILDATENCHIEMVQWLLDEGSFEKANGNILLHSAARVGTIDPMKRITMLQWLFQQYDAEIDSIDIIDITGRTVLMKTCRQPEVGLWLLQHGATAVARDHENLTILNLLFAQLEEKCHTVNFVQALMEQGAGINTDLSEVDFNRLDQLAFNQQKWILIGAHVNGRPCSHPDAINTVDELRERINTLSTPQVISLRKSVSYLLKRDPEDKNLRQMQSILQGGLALKQHCLLFIKKHSQALPENYNEILPNELTDEINNILRNIP